MLCDWGDLIGENDDFDVGEGIYRDSTKPGLLVLIKNGFFYPSIFGGLRLSGEFNFNLYNMSNGEFMREPTSSEVSRELGDIWLRLLPPGLTVSGLFGFRLIISFNLEKFSSP